jgi:hypothetical protein
VQPRSLCFLFVEESVGVGCEGEWGGGGGNIKLRF